MSVGASSAFDTPSAWARVALSLWDHRGPINMGVRVSYFSGARRPSLHGRCFPLFFEHGVPRHIGMGASFFLRPTGAPPFERIGLVRFCNIEMRSAWG